MYGALRRFILGVTVVMCVVVLTTLDGASLVPVSNRRRSLARAVSDGLPVPPVVHYIELSPPTAPFAYTLAHYLSLLGVLVRMQPAEVRWHHRALPTGEWWECAAPALRLVPADDVTHVHGRPLKLRVEHKSDVTRLGILRREGGIYLDLDVVPLRNFTELRAHEVTMGKEFRLYGHAELVGREHVLLTQGDTADVTGLCNAVILAAPNATFLSRWWGAYTDFDPGRWANHSVQLPLRLARAFPHEINVLSPVALFYPLYTQLNTLFFNDDGYDFAPNYAVHLWAAAAVQPRQRDFLRTLTVEAVFTCGGSFCRLARQLLADAHARRVLCADAATQVAAWMHEGSRAKRDWRAP